MGKRKGLTKKVRFEVFKRDSFTCQYCGRAAPDVVLQPDHINPVANGGTNEVINLLTSCVDCNAGKSDRLLDDKTVVTKQREQLKALQERREQLRMMAEWREGMLSVEEESVQIMEKHLREHYEMHINDFGRKELRKTLKKYGLAAVMDATAKSAAQYLGSGSQEEKEKTFNYIPRICYWVEKAKDKPEVAEFSRICGYAKKRWFNCYKPNLWRALEKYHYTHGIHTDDLFEAVRTSTGIMKFEDNVRELMRGPTNG